MNKKSEKRDWSFWIIAVAGFVWNLMGVVNFFVQMNPAMHPAYRESERAIIEGRPMWATVGFAIAVFGGTLGCLLLLFRKSAAVYLFAVSLVGVIVATIHAISLGIDFGLGEVVGIIVMPILAAGFLTWFAVYAKGKGWVSQ